MSAASCQRGRSALVWSWPDWNAADLHVRIDVSAHQVQRRHAEQALCRHPALSQGATRAHRGRACGIPALGTRRASRQHMVASR